jgi:apoptotic chromatin condensation inducer in the nucleus
MARETFVTAEEEVKTIMPAVTRLYNSLDEFKVTSMTTWIEAGEKVKQAKEKLKEIKSVKKVKFMDHINALRDNTIALFDPPINRLEEIIEKLDKKMSVWRNEQLEKERLAQEKAEAEAQEKERIEQERLRKEAEAKEEERRKAEKAAEEARKKAEELAKKDDFEKSERARLEAEEKTAEAKRLQEEAKDQRKEAKEVEVAPKEVKTKVTKIDGLHFRTYWKAEVIDEKKIPREFLMPNMVAINDYASKNKEAAKIPGVRIYSEDKSVG